MSKKNDSAATTAQQSVPPTTAEVKDELLKYWDADTPLTLAALRGAYEQGNSLNDVGILSREAESYVNKYNSIVFRTPGKGPVVRISEAASWATKPMPDVVEIIFKRAQP